MLSRPGSGSPPARPGGLTGSCSCGWGRALRPTAAGALCVPARAVPCRCGAGGISARATSCAHRAMSPCVVRTGLDGTAAAGASLCSAGGIWLRACSVRVVCRGAVTGAFRCWVRAVSDGPSTGPVAAGRVAAAVRGCGGPPVSWWSGPVRRPGEHFAQRVTDCAEGDLDSLPSAQDVTLRTKCPALRRTSPHAALWAVCRLSADPVSCACRNLRIRTRATFGRAKSQAPDLRGHWMHKGENGVGSALILRLRQNRPPSTARAAHKRRV